MAYVHGYSEREAQRLYEQAEILENILHMGTVFPADAKVLEAGCGVGAQTRRPSSRPVLAPGSGFRIPAFGLP
jgi:hypothetical protein